MTITQWRTPDDQTSLFLIKKNGGSIADICTIFKDMQPVVIRPEEPELRDMAERWGELPNGGAQAIHDLFCLIV